MADIDFYLADESVQSLALSTVSNVLYATLYLDDGSTTQQVPITFLFQTETETIDFRALQNAVLASDLFNDDPFREGDTRIYDAVVVPVRASYEANTALKYSKTIKIDALYSDPVLELTTGSFPTGLEFSKVDNYNYKLEGYADSSNLENSYGNFDVVGQEYESDVTDLYKNRQIEFLNVKYVTGSGLSAGDFIVNEETGDGTEVKEVETYTEAGETRTLVVVDEFSSDGLDQFFYKNERNYYDSSGSPKVDLSWLGYIEKLDGSIRLSYDDIGYRFPSVTQNKGKKDYSLTFGVRQSSSTEYDVTKELTLTVRQNFDQLRDDALVVSDKILPVQPEFDNEKHVYYSGDTLLFAYTRYLSFAKTDSTTANISVVNSQLEFTPNSQSKTFIPVEDTLLVFDKNVSGVGTQTTIQVVN
tara:strand:- start:1933 stop:3180 length:1248 start_codon:yes stop_codon:yes gene_type:complete